MAGSQRSKKEANPKLKPLFAKLLERQLLNGTISDKENDVIQTAKFPNDNADLTHIPNNVQVVETFPTSKSKDTMWVTLKAPSDKDEFTTLKWPSDSDEDIESLRDLEIARDCTPSDIVTLKYPSDTDELTMPKL